MSRRPNGTFLPGSPDAGRKPGTRTLLTKRVFNDILEHWSEETMPGGLTKGRAALDITFHERPNEYLRCVTGLLPRELIFEHVMADMGDEEIDALLGHLRNRMLELRAEQAVPVPQVSQAPQLTREKAHEPRH